MSDIDKGAKQYRKNLRKRVRNVRVLEDFGAGTKAGWNEAVDYMLEIIKHLPLPSEDKNYDG